MKYVVLAIGSLLLGATVCLASPSTAPASPQRDIEYGRPFPIVGIPDSADKDTESLARQLADAIGVKSIMRSKYNPVCCVWVQVWRWVPNPGQPAYLIINQPGGSIVLASDLDELKKAVDRFKSACRVRDGAVEVPMAVLTDLPVIK